MESALPIGCEGEGLCERKADDVARLLRIKICGVNRDNPDGQPEPLDRNIGIERLEVIKDSLFGFLQLCRVATGDSNLNKCLGLHISKEFE